MEAFSLMGAQLDIVSEGGGEEAQEGEERWEAHYGRLGIWEESVEKVLVVRRAYNCLCADVHRWKWKGRGLFGIGMSGVCGVCEC